MSNFTREFDPASDKYRCTQCGEWKHAEGFYRNPQYKYGLQSKCKTCALAYYKERYWRAKVAREDVRDKLRAEFVPMGPPKVQEDDLDIEMLTED